MSLAESSSKVVVRSSVRTHTLFSANLAFPFYSRFFSLATEAVSTGFHFSSRYDDDCPTYFFSLFKKTHSSQHLFAGSSGLRSQLTSKKSVN